MIKKFFILCIISLSVYSCSDKSSVKIGFIGDLSGSGFALCSAGRNSVEMAVTEINEMGGINGRPVELISFDHKGSKDLAYSGVKELVNSGASVVIGPFQSSMAQSVIASSLKSNILIISPTVSTDRLSGIDDNFIRVISPASKQGVDIANHIIEQDSKKVLALLDEHNRNYSHAVLDGFQSILNSTEIEQDELFLSGALDVEAIIGYVERQKPDVMFFITDGQYAGQIMKAVNQKGLDLSIYGTTWTKASGIVAHGGNAVEGMIFTDFYKSLTPTEKEREFEKRYTDSYGTAPNIASYYSYDAVYMYKRALEELKNSDSNEVKYKIVSFDEIDGITDIYNLDSYGDVRRKSSLYIVRSGNIELME